jgi:hypothetical protein
MFLRKFETSECSTKKNSMLVFSTQSEVRKNKNNLFFELQIFSLKIFLPDLYFN